MGGEMTLRNRTYAGTVSQRFVDLSIPIVHGVESRALCLITNMTRPPWRTGSKSPNKNAGKRHSLVHVIYTVGYLESVRFVLLRVDRGRIFSSLVSFLGLHDAKQTGSSLNNLPHRVRHMNMYSRFRRGSSLTSSDGLYFCPHHSNSA